MVFSFDLVLVAAAWWERCTKVFRRKDNGTSPTLWPTIISAYYSPANIPNKMFDKWPNGFFFLHKRIFMSSLFVPKVRIKVWRCLGKERLSIAEFFVDLYHSNGVQNSQITTNKWEGWKCFISFFFSFSRECKINFFKIGYIVAGMGMYCFLFSVLSWIFIIICKEIALEKS